MIRDQEPAGLVVLRLPEVCRRTGLSRATLYRAIAAGAFPRQIRLGLRARGWLSAEVETWIAGRADLREAA